MYLPPDIKLIEKLFRWSRYLVGVVLAIALLVLIGWQFDIAVFKHIAEGMPAMNPSTAICFIFTGISLLLLTGDNKTKKTNQAASFLAAVVLLIALLKISGVLMGFDLGLDKILFANKIALKHVDNIPNRMSPNAAICFVLTGTALLLIEYKSVKGLRSVHYVSIFIVLLSLVSLLGYLYQAKYFFGFLTHIQMALHTAFCFFLLGIAMLFAYAGEGVMKHFTSELSGSVTAHVLIPAAIIIPALMGLLRLWGYWRGSYNIEFGVTLYSLFTIIIFTAIAWYTVTALNKRDSRQLRTQQALRDSEQEIQAVFHNAPDAIVVIDQEGNIVKWNPESEKLFGWPAPELIGKSLADTVIPEEFRESHKKGMLRYSSSGESIIIGKTIEIWAVKKDGKPVDIALRISPLTLNGKQFFIGFIRDISEKRQIEVKLRHFNEELAKQVEDKTRETIEIFERVTDGVIALDKDFRYTYANKKAGELTHMDPAFLIGKSVWEVFPAAVGSATYNAFNQAMSEQRYITNTDHFPQFDLWQENHIYPSANGLSVFIRDISEKRKAEREISKAWTLADKLIDSLPGVFYFFDHTGKFIRWNRQFEIMTGYTVEEIAIMHPIDFFEGEEREYITKRIEQVFEKGESDAEAYFVTKSGERIPHYFKAAMVEYEGKPCLLGTGIDITERKIAEEEIRQSAEKYKLLFQSNPLSMWMLSLPDYDIIEVNDATLLQYGYSRQAFLALDVFDLRRSEGVEELKQITNRNFRGIHYAGKWEHLKKDGTVIYVDIVTHDIYYEGKPVRLVLANEITEQYLAEEKLKESYESIRQLTEHLNNIREQERLHIAREIHDELGQLLTVLKMDVSWLNKKADPNNKPVKDKIVELMTLIDTTVKTVRRIASELRPSLLDDLGLLAAMEWHMEEFERRSGIEGVTELPAEELRLPDSLKIGLFRIMQESLTNVARHSGAKKVSVKLHQDNKQLILTIADNGNGFDEDLTKKKTLGLLGMRERTSVMGGDCRIISKPGEGTTVTVTVPLPD